MSLQAPKFFIEKYNKDLEIQIQKQPIPDLIFTVEVAFMQILLRLRELFISKFENLRMFFLHYNS